MECGDGSPLWVWLMSQAKASTRRRTPKTRVAQPLSDRLTSARIAEPPGWGGFQPPGKRFTPLCNREQPQTDNRGIVAESTNRCTGLAVSADTTTPSYTEWGEHWFYLRKGNPSGLLLFLHYHLENPRLVGKLKAHCKLSA